MRCINDASQAARLGYLRLQGVGYPICKRSDQLFRLIALIEALILLAAASVYAGGLVVTGFVLMLGAYHWTTITIIGLSAVAALACVVLAIFLLMKPRRNLMASGMILIVPAGILALATYASPMKI